MRPNQLDIPDILRRMSKEELLQVTVEAKSRMAELNEVIIPLRKKITDLEAEFVFAAMMKEEAERRLTPVKVIPYQGKDKKSKKKAPGKKRVSKLNALKAENEKKQAILDKLMKMKGL